MRRISRDSSGIASSSQASYSVPSSGVNFQYHQENVGAVQQLDIDLHEHDPQSVYVLPTTPFSNHQLSTQSTSRSQPQSQSHINQPTSSTSQSQPSPRSLSQVRALSLRSDDSQNTNNILSTEPNTGFQPQLIKNRNRQGNRERRQNPQLFGSSGRRPRKKPVTPRMCQDILVKMCEALRRSKKQIIDDELFEEFVNAWREVHIARGYDPGDKGNFKYWYKNQKKYFRIIDEAGSRDDCEFDAAEGIIHFHSEKVKAELIERYRHLVPDIAERLKKPYAIYPLLKELDLKRVTNRHPVVDDSHSGDIPSNGVSSLGSNPINITDILSHSSIPDIEISSTSPRTSRIGRSNNQVRRSQTTESRDKTQDHNQAQKNNRISIQDQASVRNRDRSQDQDEDEDEDQDQDQDQDENEDEEEDEDEDQDQDQNHIRNHNRDQGPDRVQNREKNQKQNRNLGQRAVQTQDQRHRKEHESRNIGIGVVEIEENEPSVNILNLDTIGQSHLIRPSSPKSTTKVSLLQLIDELNIFTQDEKARFLSNYLPHNTSALFQKVERSSAQDVSRLIKYTLYCMDKNYIISKNNNTSIL